MKKVFRISIAVAIGFGIAMLIMSIAIYFGYSNAYRLETQNSEVYLLGINIYHLSLSGSNLSFVPR